jgi:hypothetical protein
MQQRQSDPDMHYSEREQYALEIEQAKERFNDEMQKKEQELMKEYRNMMENLLTESDHK